MTKAVSCNWHRYFQEGTYRVHENKEDQQGRTPFKESRPTTYIYNRKHLKGWAKIPIPKQLEDEHIEKEKKRKKVINVLGIA